MFAEPTPGARLAKKVLVRTRRDLLPVTRNSPKSTRARPVLDTYGIGPRTAFTWQTQHDEFRQAVEEGRTKFLLFWERVAIALSKGEAGNAAIVTLGL